MTSLNGELDVQSHLSGVAVTYPTSALDENLPGQLNLTDDEARTLEYMLREHRLNRLGIQPLTIPAGDVQKGDAIPNLGLQVQSASRNEGWMRIHGGMLKLIELPAQQEITVNRSII